MTSRQRRRSEASYDALVRAAIRQFQARGYAATSVDDIVKDTDYSRGSFYFHFTSKLHCFLAVIAYRQQLRGDWAQIPRERDVRTTSLDVVLVEALTALNTTMKGMERWVLLMVECYQQTRGDEEIQQRFREVYATWTEELATFVRNLQDGGWVDPGRDTALLTARVFAFVEGLTAHHTLYELGGISLQEALLGGLLALLPPPPRTPAGESAT